MTKWHELEFELLHRPAYFPYDFFLFPNLEIWLGRKRFYSNEETIAAVDKYFEDLQTSYYSEGIKKLQNSWSKCVELQRDYVQQ